MNKRPRVLLSFDVEEFDIPEEYGQPISMADKIKVSADGLGRILTLLDELNEPATFFTTAVFAEARPDLIQRMAGKHEIASHGFYHSQFSENDLARSREVLQKISGQTIDGFRRARFAPTSRPAIHAAGYTYNSSENPIFLPGRYCHIFHPRLPYRTNGLLNIPISSSPLVRFPFFWLGFKNFPLPVFQTMSRWNLRQDGFLNLIFHPWEFSDLRSYRLPSFVKKQDGDGLLEKLRAYLLWLQQSTSYVTFRAFALTCKN